MKWGRRKSEMMGGGGDLIWRGWNLKWGGGSIWCYAIFSVGKNLYSNFLPLLGDEWSEMRMRKMFASGCQPPLPMFKTFAKGCQPTLPMFKNVCQWLPADYLAMSFIFVRWQLTSGCQPPLPMFSFPLDCEAKCHWTAFTFSGNTSFCINVWWGYFLYFNRVKKSCKFF